MFFCSFSSRQFRLIVVMGLIDSFRDGNRVVEISTKSFSILEWHPNSRFSVSKNLKLISRSQFSTEFNFLNNFSTIILFLGSFLDLYILVENKAKWYLIMSLCEWNEMLLIERVINFTKATLNMQDYDLSEAFLFKITFRWWLSGDSRHWSNDLNNRPVENILSTSQLVGLKYSIIIIL